MYFNNSYIIFFFSQLLNHWDIINFCMYLVYFLLKYNWEISMTFYY